MSEVSDYKKVLKAIAEGTCTQTDKCNDLARLVLMKHSGGKRKPTEFRAQKVGNKVGPIGFTPGGAPITFNAKNGYTWPEDPTKAKGPRRKP